MGILEYMENAIITERIFFSPLNPIGNRLYRNRNPADNLRDFRCLPGKLPVYFSQKCQIACGFFSIGNSIRKHLIADNHQFLFSSKLQKRLDNRLSALHYSFPLPPPRGDEVPVSPGHGPESTIGHEVLYNPFIVEVLNEEVNYKD